MKQLRLLSLILISCLPALAQTKDDVRSLKFGERVERELAGNESHTYLVALKTGQFLSVAIEQKGVDVTETLLGPDGNKLVESDLAASFPRESLSHEAVTSGEYRLVVRPFGTGAAKGSYSLRAEVKTSTRPQDKQRVIAEALLTEAVKLTRLRSAESGIAKAQESLRLWREIGEQYWTASSLNVIGHGYRILGQHGRAIEFYEQALVVYRELKDNKGQFGILENLGYSYLAVDQYKEAIESYEQALAIRLELKDRRREALVLTNLAGAYDKLSQFEKAIEIIERAADIYHELKNDVGEADALNQMAFTYSSLGRYEKTIENLERALVIDRELKNREGEARRLSHLGFVHNIVGRNEKAVEFLEQALVIIRERQDRRREGITLTNLAGVYGSLGHNQTAIEHYEQALLIAREFKEIYEEARNLEGLASAYLALGRNDKAVDFYGQAHVIYRDLKYRNGESGMLTAMGGAYMRMGRYDKASEFITQAINIVESVRSDVISPESRASFLSVTHGAYQLYTDLLMRRHKAEPGRDFDARAFENSERQRARSLLDLLAEARSDVHQGVDPELLEREREVGRQLSGTAKQLMEAKTPAEVAALKQEVSRLENDYERAQTAIRKASPHYAAFTQPQPLKLGDIQSQLDADTLLLEYSLGEDRSYLWVIGRDSLTSYELPKRAMIEKSALELYEYLTARSTNRAGETAAQRQERVNQAEAKLPAAALDLSKMIMAPAAAQLGNKRLIIVADGALQYIPFAMLPDPNSAGFANAQSTVPLIVTHEVLSSPSASVLALQRNELAGRKPAPQMLAVIADPVFDRTDARFKTSAVDEKATVPTGMSADTRGLEHIAESKDAKTGRLVIRRLPFTRNEADALLALTPKESSFKAIDFQANRTNVLNGDLAQYKYVHFATHGVMDAERPGLSSLVLSTVDAAGKPQNGFLRANDIYNMKLPAELVVLSACQTGLGKEVKGEGLIGLTRGFMYAGAKRVVVSLWSVNDKATSDLMTKFYRGMLKDNERPAAALRAAQIEMWKQKKWQSPYYWAAFTMQGEWR